MRRIIAALQAASLCGLGTGLADFALSAFQSFPQEMADAFHPDE